MMAKESKAQVPFKPTLHAGIGKGVYYAAPMIHSGANDYTKEHVLAYHVWNDKVKHIVNNPARGTRVWMVCRGLFVIPMQSMCFDNFDEADGKAYELSLQETSENRPLYNYDNGVLPLMIWEGETY
jgi:hypothetical protein